MKLMPKLLTGFLVVSAIVLIAGAIGIYSANNMKKSADFILNEKVPLAAAAMELTISLTEQQSALHAYMIGEKEAKGEFEESGSSFVTILRELKELNITSSQAEVVSRLETLYPKFVKDATGCMDYFDEAMGLKEKSGEDMEVMDEAAGPLIEFATNKGFSVNQMNIINEQVMTVNDYLITGSDDEVKAFNEVANEIKAFPDYNIIRSAHQEVLRLAEITINSYDGYLVAQERAAA